MEPFKEVLPKLFEKKFLIYLLLAAAFVPVRVIFISEPLNSDDLTLFGNSKALATGEHGIFKNKLPERANQHSLRFGLLIPEAILIKVFGPNFIAYYLLPLIFSLGGFLLIISISKEFLPLGVVALMALIHMVFPFETRHSSLLLTDLPAAFFLLAYIYYIYKHGLDQFELAKVLLRSFIASCLIFWGYLLRENQFILALPAVVVFVCYRRYRWIAFGSLAFFFLLLMGEQLFYVSKGGPFGYRWAVTEASIANYAKFLPEYGVKEFIIRSFKFVHMDMRRMGVIVYVAALVFHVYGFFAWRNPLVKAVLLSGFATFIIFNFYVYQAAHGVVTALPCKHRYLQMCYYSSLIAAPFSLYSIYALSKRRFFSFVDKRNLRLVFRYLASSITLLIFIYVFAIFWRVSYKCRGRLLNPSGKYMSMLSAINDEMTNNNKDRIEIFGTSRSLRAISLFNRPSRRHSIKWRSLSIEELKSKLGDSEADYFLIDQHRETMDLRYLKGRAQEEKKALLESIAQIAAKNYGLICEGRDFAFFKSRDGRGERASPE